MPFARNVGIGVSPQKDVDFTTMHFPDADLLVPGADLNSGGRFFHRSADLPDGPVAVVASVGEDCRRSLEQIYQENVGPEFHQKLTRLKVGIFLYYLEGCRAGELSQPLWHFWMDYVRLINSLGVRKRLEAHKNGGLEMLDKVFDEASEGVTALIGSLGKFYAQVTDFEQREELDRALMPLRYTVNEEMPMGGGKAGVFLPFSLHGMIFDLMRVEDGLKPMLPRELKRANFDFAYFSDTALNGFSFSRIHAACATFEDVDFVWVDFQNGQFPSTCFRGGVYRFCDFRGADLSSSIFQGARFENCNFVGAELVGAYVEDVECEGCQFSQELTVSEGRLVEVENKFKRNEHAVS